MSDDKTPGSDPEEAPTSNEEIEETVAPQAPSPPPPPPERPETIGELRKRKLRESIVNSQELVQYASRNGTKIPDNVLKTVTETAHTFEADAGLDNTQEVAFWSAYRTMTEHMSPVSVESIRWVRDNGKKTAYLFAFLGFLSLAALIYVQIRWVYINNASAQIESLTKDHNKKRAVRESTKASVTILKQIVENAAKIQQQPQKADAPQGSESVSDRALSLKQAKEKLAKEDSKLNILNDELLQMRKLLEAQYRILSDSVPDLASTNPKPKEPGWFDSDAETKEKLDAIKTWRETLKGESEFEREYSLAQAGFIIAVMSTYVLPMLYGLLGTIAFILRSLSQEIRQVVLAQSSIIIYLVRLPLGMLSGIAVGWVLSADALPTGLGSIQPLALAFVAGYSVELLFTAMDKLIGAFTSATPKPQGG